MLNDEPSLDLTISPSYSAYRILDPILIILNSKVQQENPRLLRFVASYSVLMFEFFQALNHRTSISKSNYCQSPFSPLAQLHGAALLL